MIEALISLEGNNLQPENCPLVNWSNNHWSKNVTNWDKKSHNSSKEVNDECKIWHFWNMETASIYALLFVIWSGDISQCQFNRGYINHG